jgi:hypothetical protein
MKKFFPISLMVLGVIFMLAGGYTIYRGVDAKDQVKTELLAQSITTPEDASIPNVVVKDVRTAQSMADIINHHALDSTGGLTYSQMGRFAVASGDPAGTNVADEAIKGADGKPVANGLRNTAFQAAALRTSLYTSVMAFNVADLVAGLGLMIVITGLAIGGLGFALAGLVFPSLARKVHVEPVATS